MVGARSHSGLVCARRIPGRGYDGGPRRANHPALATDMRLLENIVRIFGPELEKPTTRPLVPGTEL